MPEIMKPYFRQPRTPEQGFERAVEKVAGVKRGADARRENQTLLLPQAPQAGLLPILLHLVALGRFYGTCCQMYATASLCRLWLIVAFAVRSQRATHSQYSALEV